MFHCLNFPIKISFLSVTNNLYELQFSYISINNHLNFHEVNRLGTNILTATKFRGDTPWLILSCEVEFLITIIYTSYLDNVVSTNFLNNINQVSGRNSTFAKKKKKIMYQAWFLFSKFRQFRNNINKTLREDVLHISLAFTFFGNIVKCSFSIHIAFISQN